MRELKFRQALMSFGKFCGWHYWGFIDGKFVSPAESAECSVANAEKHSYQFTELQDVKAKEVYHGDILLDRLNKRWLVDYHDGSYWLKHLPLRNARIITRFCQEMSDDLEYEVVGNNVENPDLLAPP